MMSLFLLTFDGNAKLWNKPPLRINSPSNKLHSKLTFANKPRGYIQGVTVVLKE